MLFDFSGTLFHIEPPADAVRIALGDELLHLVPELVRRGALNGSARPPDVPPELSDAWDDRDLSADAHRAAYAGAGQLAGLTAEQATRLYDRGVAADAWLAYPDTVRTLRELRARQIPVAVVSNIGWDPRPVLDRHGVAEHIDVLVLSDERGVVKPDPTIFAMACAELGVSPRHCVMIGDNPDNDGGCVTLGIEFRLVDEDPARRPPDALWVAAGLAGACPRRRLTADG